MHTLQNLMNPHMPARPHPPDQLTAISAACVQGAISLNQVLQAHGRSSPLPGAKYDQLQRQLRLHRQDGVFEFTGGTSRKTGGGKEEGKRRQAN